MNRLRRYPPHILVAKIIKKIFHLLSNFGTRKRDQLFSTYGTHLPKRQLLLTSKLPSALLEPDREQILEIANLFLDHRFDLLGSGWVKVAHGMQSDGIDGHVYPAQSAPKFDQDGAWLIQHVNRANVPYARKIWASVTNDYQPIDWQIDFRSGFRWSQQTWYQDIRYGNDLGADVKMPWELARMQHLSYFVWAYILTQDDIYVQAFQNQVLDFIATNPPRYGVNWKTTMDVAIRVSNWLLVYDLFSANGASFSTAFDNIFWRSIDDHGNHIFHNLEWSPTVRGNHYLSNIVGLLFVGVYLHHDDWMDFSRNELINEVNLQFNPDGSNFEASTCYHRLSAEMLVFATALLMRCGKPIPYIERLQRMLQFVLDITKPDGHVPQIGDNDNGRFFKLQPVYHQIHSQAKKQSHWEENFLNHQHLIDAIQALFETPYASHSVDAYVVRQLANHTLNNVPLVATHAIGTSLKAYETQLSNLQETVTVLPLPQNMMLNPLQHFAYPDFGLYGFRTERLYFVIRCGTVGQHGNGGHAHNDQLGFELQIDKQDTCQDPGTYVYTSLPEQRNHYRSAYAHWVPVLGNEQDEPAPLDQGLFKLPDQTQARCLYFGDEGFLGMHIGYGQELYRQVTFEADSIIIRDYATEKPHFNRPSIPYSHQYGAKR